MENIEQLKYPIGPFSPPENITNEVIVDRINVIEAFPKKLRKAIENKSREEINSPYRPGGWTVKQLVHHLADSHMNAYIRFKWTLTEDNPSIKTYEEKKWAELDDSKVVNIEVSIALVTSLHTRWVALLKSMNSHDFQKTFFHPEMKQTIALDRLLCLYAWHCNHHLAHIVNQK